jgi:hypothetical protein
VVIELHFQQLGAVRNMTEPISAAIIVRTLCSAYLFSTVILLALVCLGWWWIEKIEQTNNSTTDRFFRYF